MTKTEVHRVAVQEIEKRLEGLSDTLSDTTSSMQNETKSSAGDKHETARSMAQLEQEKLGNQIQVTKTLFSALDKINPDEKHDLIQFGSLVKIEEQWYYFSAGIGKISVEDEFVYCLSIVTPIGKLLTGKKVGDQIDFNGKKAVISIVS